MEKLRLCYVHNVPNKPVFIDIDSVKQAFGVSAIELSQAQAILAKDAKAVFKQNDSMLVFRTTHPFHHCLHIYLFLY